MEKVREVCVVYDAEGNTLDVWFDNPKKEHICAETAEEVILKKDKQGRVIGFEKLNFLPLGAREKKPAVKVVVG
ncbi:MAG: DUF2283 domain-containing protein [Planctomycetes bacterium]|nr:DUF2283 domain-containing protein [Planctomycetota bacterium]